MCVKCHITCKQCIGESLNKCKECYPDFVLKNIIYDYECISCLYNFNKNGAKPQKCMRCLENSPPSIISRNNKCEICLNK